VFGVVFLYLTMFVVTLRISGQKIGLSIFMMKNTKILYPWVTDWSALNAATAKTVFVAADVYRVH
jgi:hypothetical protein